MDTIQGTPEKATEMLFEVVKERNPNSLGVRAAMIGKANINALKDGVTPLMVATIRNELGSHIDIINELLINGADPNIADTVYGITPLDHAIRRERTRAKNENANRTKKRAAAAKELVELLRSHGAKTSAELCNASGKSDGKGCAIAGGKRRRNRTNKKTRKTNKKRHTVRRRR